MEKQKVSAQNKPQESKKRQKVDILEWKNNKQNKKLSRWI